MAVNTKHNRANTFILFISFRLEVTEMIDEETCEAADFLVTYVRCGCYHHQSNTIFVLIGTSRWSAKGQQNFGIGVNCPKGTLYDLLRGKWSVSKKRTCHAAIIK